jgi:hypothetical protein
MGGSCTRSRPETDLVEAAAWLDPGRHALTREGEAVIVAATAATSIRRRPQLLYGPLRRFSKLRFPTRDATADRERGCEASSVAQAILARVVASFEERICELGSEALAEQERQVAEVRGCGATLLAAGAVIASLLAKPVFDGDHPLGFA